MVETYLVRCPLPKGTDPGVGRASLAALMSLDAEGVVVSAWSSLLSEAIELALLIEADDPGSADRTARGLLERAHLDSGDPGPADPEPVGRLLFCSDLDDVLASLGRAAHDVDRRPPVKLPPEIAEALGPELLTQLGAQDGIGARVRLGRVWTRQEDWPAHRVPWRTYDGADVGLPVTTRLATLAGAAFLVNVHGIEDLHDRLESVLREYRWSAFTLGESVEEWFGSAGFRTVLNAPRGRLALGLFPVADPIDMVWFHGTTGLGSGVGTEELALRLGSWADRYGALPIEVGPTFVSLRIAEAADLEALCAQAVGLSRAAHAYPRVLPVDRDREAATFQSIARMLERTGRLTLDWT